MSGFIIGTKQKQTQIYDDHGALLPATAIHTEKCYLVGIKVKETDGYQAAIIGYGSKKSIKKPVKGLLAKANISENLKYIKEIRLEDNKKITCIEESGKKGISFGDNKFFIGDVLVSSKFFKPGDIVDITGTSKGKGYQGVVRRHGFAGGPKTHGQSNRHRAPGSVGPNTTPGHVFRGTRMAGQKGSGQATVKNLTVIEATDTHLVVKGLVPGHIGNLLKVFGYSQS